MKQAQGVAQAEVNKAQGIAEAEIKQAQGLAVAEAQKAQGLAEALAMEKKAEAWRKYNEAAVLQILAPILPEIARAIAEPLSKIDRITLVNTGNGDTGVSRITNEIAKVITQVPPVVESLTGLNMEKLFDHLRESQVEGRAAEEVTLRGSGAGDEPQSFHIRVSARIWLHSFPVPTLGLTVQQIRVYTPIDEAPVSGPDDHVRRGRRGSRPHDRVVVARPGARNLSSASHR